MRLSYDLKKSVGHLAGLASRLMSNTLAARFQAAGIDMTAEQWGAVVVLLNGDALTQNQLGAQLYLEKSSVSRLLDGLEQRDWIARTRDPKDSRKRIVTLTPRALDTVKRCTDIAMTVLDDAQRGMTGDEQVVCRSLLSRIIANFDVSGR